MLNIILLFKNIKELKIFFVYVKIIMRKEKGCLKLELKRKQKKLLKLLF